MNLRPPGYEPDELPTALLRDMVPETGVEPARDFSHGILSPRRLPIPPLRHFPVSTFECLITIAWCPPFVKDFFLFFKYFLLNSKKISEFHRFLLQGGMLPVDLLPFGAPCFRFPPQNEPPNAKNKALGGTVTLRLRSPLGFLLRIPKAISKVLPDEHQPAGGADIGSRVADKGPHLGGKGVKIVFHPGIFIFHLHHPSIVCPPGSVPYPGRNFCTFFPASSIE